MVFGLDLAFDAMNKYGLTKLQETVENIDSDNSNESEDSESETSSEDSEDVTVEGEESTDTIVE